MDLSPPLSDCFPLLAGYWRRSQRTPGQARRKLPPSTPRVWPLMDVAGVVGGEEQRGVRDVLGLPWTYSWHPYFYFCVERSNVSVSPPTEGGSRAELPFDLPWGESHTASVTSRLT